MQGAEPALRSITSADTTVLAVYTEGWTSGQPRRLIQAIWKDGYIAWSGDRLEGGAPYYEGRIDPKRLDSLLAKLEHDGLFAEKSLAKPRFGPDSPFTTILIRFGDSQIELRSWHELYESGGKAVGATSGLSGLNGRRLFEALKEQPSDYLFFRFVWSEILRTCGRTCSLGRNAFKRGGGDERGDRFFARNTGPRTNDPSKLWFVH